MKQTSRAVRILAVFFLAGCSKPAPRVVLYCAQDREFAEPLFGEFQNRTGLTIAPKFDTEAAKSVGLATEIGLDAKHPRCDVHWNNEILGTIRLQRHGVYAPLGELTADPALAWAQSADRGWIEIGARARVIIVNTNLVPEAERPKSILDLTDPKWKGRVALAKPLYGTTATQAAALFDAIGPEAATAFYRGLKDNDVKIVSGNKHVAEGVARGDFALGLTDTDDALGEIEAGKPVAMIFPDRDGHPKQPNLGVLFIPNTLAMIKGCPNPEGAKKLIAYLGSAEVEKKLAESASHQIPMNPNVKATLPAGMPMPAQVKSMAVDWRRAADCWADSQSLLSDLFGR